MKFTEIVPYKLKRALSMTLIASMPMLASCGKKEEPAEPSEPPAKPEEVVSFTQSDLSTKFDSAKLQKLASNPNVKSVTLEAEGDWSAFTAEQIAKMNATNLKPVFAMSTKFQGKGHFNFPAGEASKVQNDSLDYVRYGYTLGAQKSDTPPAAENIMEVVFNPNTMIELLFPLRLQKILNDDPTIDTMYLIPDADWGYVMAYLITAYREQLFQPALEASPKVRAKGDFNFKLGEASKVPADSLWYVQQGWTINQAKQR